MVEPLLMLITALWVFFGAVFIMPYFVNRKINKEGGTVDTVVDKAVNKIKAEIPDPPDFSKILPQDLPTMAEVNRSIDHLGSEIHRNIPTLINDYIQSDTFENTFRTFEGRMYRAKGIELDKLKRMNDDYVVGMEAAEKVYLSKIQNPDPNDNSELKFILHDALNIAEQAGFIEEGSTEQKMGLVHGVLQLIERLQSHSKNRTSSPLGVTPTHPTFSFKRSNGGSELDNYYR